MPSVMSRKLSDVVLLSSPDGGALLRVIAGEIDGHAGPGSTHTPIVMVHATLQPGARLDVPWNPSFNALAYGLEGSGTVGPDDAPFGQGRLALFGPGDSLVLQADADSTLDVLLLGGEPIREPVAMQGPFVMNTRAELAQAFDDFQSGRLGTIPAGALRPFRG